MTLITDNIQGNNLVGWVSFMFTHYYIRIKQLLRVNS